MAVRFTPEMFVAQVAGRKGLAVDDMRVAPVVVLAWNPGIVRSMADAIGAQLSPHWIRGEQYPLYTGEVNGQPVSIAHIMVGAPGTVMQMEMLIACGARVFLGVGYTGSLQPSAPIGTFLIPTACICEEGTSAHYLNVETAVGASLPLVEILQESCQTEGVKVISGQVWTTDALFRELISKIERYRAQGVLGVDMETSAMYALGHFRGVAVCNLLVVSDELWCEWRVAFGTHELHKAEQCAQRVILRCLTKRLV